jgi:hypothetical protein
VAAAVYNIRTFLTADFSRKKSELSKIVSLKRCIRNLLYFRKFKACLNLGVFRGF